MESSFDLSHIAIASGAGSLEYQAEVSSTNDWALQLAADDDRAWPLLVLTAKQTGGRGRGANAWFSAEGSLTFSLVVDAKAHSLPPDRWPLLALVTGVAVCESLQAMFPAGLFGLKWPNDVYLNGRKLCGILVEAPSQAHGRIVIGVGINVNNSLAAAPPEVRARATSLSDEADGRFDLNETLCAVVQRLLERIEEFAARPNRILEDFRRCCMLSHKWVVVQQGRESIAGLCEGIHESGALLVQTGAGVRRIVSGSIVSFEPPN